MKKLVFSLLAVIACIPAMAQTKQADQSTLCKDASACTKSLIVEWKSKLPFNAAGFSNNSCDVTNIETPKTPIIVTMEIAIPFTQIEEILNPIIQKWDEYVTMIGEGADANALAKSCYNLQIPFTLVYKSSLDGKSLKTPFSLLDIEKMAKITL